MQTIRIKGMSCQHCVNSVKKALEQIDEVKSVEVNLEKGEASFEGAPSKEHIRSAITAFGFEVIEQ